MIKTNWLFMNTVGNNENKLTLVLTQKHFFFSKLLRFQTKKKLRANEEGGGAIGKEAYAV
jgi:hypothetical protein